LDNTCAYNYNNGSSLFKRYNMMNKETELLVVGALVGFTIGVTLMAVMNIRKEVRIMERYNIEVEYEPNYYEDNWQY